MNYSFIVFLLVFSAMPPHVYAQSAWPANPIRIISPNPPGGENDMTARILAERLAPVLGQPVVVENKAGAGSRIASEFVAKSPADGYTLLYTGAPHTTNPGLFDKLPYDTVKDFDAIVRTILVPVALAVPASSSIRTAKEFLEQARAKPQTITVASSGNGTGPHLAIGLFSASTGVSLVHVPYKGVSPAVTDLVAAHVNAGVLGISNLHPFVASGKLRALAVVSPKRIPQLSSAPTMSELGYPQVDASGWFGLVGPAGLSRDIVTRLNTEVNRILALPEVIKRLENAVLVPVGGSAQEFDRFIRQDIERWTKIIRQYGIKAD